MTEQPDNRVCLRCGIKFASRALYPCIVKGRRADDHEWEVVLPSMTMTEQQDETWLRAGSEDILALVKGLWFPVCNQRGEIVAFTNTSENRDRIIADHTLVQRYREALETTKTVLDHYQALNSVVGLFRLYASKGSTEAKALVDGQDLDRWANDATGLEIKMVAAGIRLREALAQPEGERP